MTDDMQKRLAEAAKKLPPPDPQLVAITKQENREAWELVAIPTIFQTTGENGTYQGKLQKINLNELIGYLRNLGQRLGFNDRKKTTVFDGEEVKKGDIDKTYVRLAAIGLEISKEKAKDAVETVAGENRFDPVERYLSNLSVDDPIDPYSVAEKYLGVTDELSQRQVGKWLVGAVQ